MDKKIAGFLGAVAGLATLGSAQAAIAPPPSQSAALRATSYADLLAPVPNALEALKAADATLARQPPARVQLAQDQYHHHHHHHHHQQVPLGFFGGGVGPHCHWVWGRGLWNGYRWVRQHVRVCD